MSSCEERIDKEYEGTMDTLRKLWRAYCSGHDGGMPHEDEFDEPGEDCPICEADVEDIEEADSSTDICKDCCEELYNTGRFKDYGLGFDYVPEGTFGEQKEAYFRYQLSWGGPSDEFRFFVNPDFTPHRIEYWFLDWFDGAHVTLEGEDEGLLEEIFEFFREVGSVEAEYEQTREA